MKKLLLFLILLLGCASPPGFKWEEGYDWEIVPSKPPLPHQYIVVSQEQLFQTCWGRYSGCVIRNNGMCYIFTEADPPEWLKKHEEKHCAGYSHLQK